MTTVDWPFSGRSSTGSLFSEEEEEKAIIQEWKLKDFDIGRNLGNGQFGQVHLARERASKFACVIKVLFKSVIQKRNLEYQIQREVDIHMSLRHPNILRMYGFFHDESRIYMVLEFAERGDLHDVKEKTSDILCEKDCSKYIGQICEALIYCQQNEVIHRDIKLENILINKNGDVKLSDFGWSVKSKPGERRKTLCGTLDYLAKEIIECSGLLNVPSPNCDSDGYDNLVDVWALGVLLFECLTGKVPFMADKYEDTYNMITTISFTFPDGDIELSTTAKDLIQKMISPINTRITIADVLKHPFISYLNE